MSTLRGRWLRSVRGDQTQGQFAARLGVARATANRWENGVSPVPERVLTACHRIAAERLWPPPLSQYEHPKASDLAEMEGPTGVEAQEMADMERIFASQLRRVERREAKQAHPTTD